MIARIWLTFKQHRFETIAITVVCVVLTAAALTGLSPQFIECPISCFNGRYESTVSGTHLLAGAHCQALVDSFMGLQSGLPMNLVRPHAPAGALLRGRTGRAAGCSRDRAGDGAAFPGSVWLAPRWLSGQVLRGVVLLVPLMLAVGLAAEVLEGALDPGVDTHAAFQTTWPRFLRPILGACRIRRDRHPRNAFGRTMPALIVAFVVCVFVRARWTRRMARIVLGRWPLSRRARTSSLGVLRGRAWHHRCDN